VETKAEGEPSPEIPKKVDNVNQYAVKFKLGQKKIGRANKNAAQIKVYQRLLEVLEERKAPRLGPT